MAAVFQAIALTTAEGRRGGGEEEQEKEEEGRKKIQPRPVTMHIGEGKRGACQICGIDR